MESMMMSKRQYMMVLATVVSVMSGVMTFAASLQMTHWMLPCFGWNVTASLLFWREFIDGDVGG